MQYIQVGFTSRQNVIGASYTSQVGFLIIGLVVLAVAGCVFILSTLAFLTLCNLYHSLTALAFSLFLFGDHIFEFLSLALNTPCSPERP